MTTLRREIGSFGENAAAMNCPPTSRNRTVKSAPSEATPGVPSTSAGSSLLFSLAQATFSLRGTDTGCSITAIRARVTSFDIVILIPTSSTNRNQAVLVPPLDHDLILIAEHVTTPHIQLLSV